MNFQGSALGTIHYSRFFAGCMLVSLGILLAAGGGSWDITNHLLNKPETFFAPPHAVLYAGVGSAVAGAVMVSRFASMPAKLVIAGAAMLVSAGPVDFAWHSAFGLDGLLSPPHFVLVSGMIASSIGALAGMVRYKSATRIHERAFESEATLPSAFVIIGILPVWLAVSGLVHMFSLPFSETGYFDFNPDPTFAVIFATISFPLLTSICLYGSSALARRKRFGVLSATGAAFLATAILTTIIPNQSLVPTIPFYLLNIIPIVVADVMLLLSPRRSYIAGAILGLAFFMIYYPLITHTYNEFLMPNRSVWPTLTAPIYFEMIGTVFPLVAVPAAAMGALGAVAGSKLANRFLRMA